MVCSQVDRRPAIYWWTGRVYSIVPGERDRLLFNVQGMNIRHCLSLEDPVRGGDYQDSVGDQYHSMEFDTNSQPLANVLDRRATEVQDSIMSWGRISNWLPWMEMGDREGVVVFHTTGVRVKNFDEMPDVVKNEIRLNYPIYAEPPPIDYKKARETSWTVFKDYIDAKRAKEAADKAGAAK